jgi:hypothetical protein
MESQNIPQSSQEIGPLEELIFSRNPQTAGAPPPFRRKGGRWIVREGVFADSSQRGG